VGQATEGSTGQAVWEEIRELVTESYRILAPKKLIALPGNRPGPGAC
jgi:hypothetical protein